MDVANRILALVLIVATFSGCASFKEDRELLTRYDDPSGTKPQQAWTAAKTAFGYGPDQQIAQKSFQEAESIFRQATKNGKDKNLYLRAAKAYRKAAQRWPDSKIEEDSLFMSGESFFFADRYPAASNSFDQVIKKYPNTRHLDLIDSRRFSLARYWIDHNQVDPDLPITPNLTNSQMPRFDKFGHGVRVLDRIRLDDPTGKLADDATMSAAVSNFQKGKYVRADELFTDLRKSFPNSEHQFQAHLLGLKSKMKIFLGAQYSMTPLEEAQQILKQIQVQFPEQAREHQQYLTSAAKELRMNMAMFHMEMARYYDRRKEYGSARHYYEMVRAEYPDTSLAKDAMDRVAQIANNPAKPSQKLPWLIAAFPTKTEDKPLTATRAFDRFTR